MHSSQRVLSRLSRASGDRRRAARTRLEHRLRQIDRLMTQDAVTPSALQVLEAEKRCLLAELEAQPLRA